MNSIATFFRESRTARFLIPMGIILIIFSVFLFLAADHNKDFIKTEAVITRADLVKDVTYDVDGNREEATYNIFIKYTVNGTEYEGELDNMYEHKVGDKITIVYNPDDPNEFSQPSSMIFAIAMLAGGIAALLGGIISAANAVKRYKKMKNQVESWKDGK